MAGSNSLPKTSKPSDSDLESYSDDGDLKDLLVKKQHSLDTLRDTGEQLRLDVKNLEDELARRKRRRLDQHVDTSPTSTRAPSDYLSFLDVLASTLQPLPYSLPSPPSPSRIESSKCTIRELLALPFTSITMNQQHSFLSAVFVLTKAFLDHSDRLGHMYSECSSLFRDRTSCHKAVRHFREKLQPLYDVKDDLETTKQKAADLEPEMDKLFIEYYDKEHQAEEAKKATLRIKSQIELLQEELKSKEAEVAGLRDEAKALLLKRKELYNQHEAMCSHLRSIIQSSNSMKPNWIRWSQKLHQAWDKYRSLAEKWNSLLSKFDLDSLVQSSSTQTPSRGELSDSFVNPEEVLQAIRSFSSWCRMEDQLIYRGKEKIDEDNGLAECLTKARIYYPSSDDSDPVEICYTDMNCLAPARFLTAPIIDFYVRYLQQQTSLREGSEIDCLFLNTNFYQKLNDFVSSKQNNRGTLSVNLRRSLKGVNIFRKAYVLIPIHQYCHWSLAIICIPDKEDESGPLILHLDFPGVHPSRSVFDKLKRYVIEEWRYLNQESACSDIPIADGIWKNLDTKVRVEITKVPKPTDYHDCGLFVLYYIQRFIDEAPKRLKKDIPKFFGEQWFQPKEASDLRVKIRDLLKKEFHKSHKQNNISSNSQ